MKWVLLAVGVLAGLVAVMWVVGSMLPKEHVATRMARYSQPPEKIWEALTNIEEMPKWRTELKSIQRLPDMDGKPAWVETSSHGEMPIVVVEWNPPRRMVGKINDPKLPFGGTWTYEITPVEGGATLRITENGEVYPAIFRFMSRYIFGYTATIETYLKNLGTKFGESVTAQP